MQHVRAIDEKRKKLYAMLSTAKNPVAVQEDKDKFLPEKNILVASWIDDIFVP